jgi:hypothetical protein
MGHSSDPSKSVSHNGNTFDGWINDIGRMTASRQKRPFLNTGRIVREVKVANEPESLLQVLENPIYSLKRIGH